MPPDILAQNIQRAMALFQRRAFAEAESSCQSILLQFGEEANALMILGLIQLEAGQSNVAIGFLERARAANLSHIHVLANLGIAYRSVGRLSEARGALESALQIDWKFAIAHTSLGNVLLDMGDRVGAKGSYERAVAAQPNAVDAIANLARIAEESHRLSDALRLSQRALTLMPGHSLAGLTLARALQRSGETERAVTEYERLLRAASLSQTNRIVVAGYMGEGLEKLGRYHEAFAAFKEANDAQFALHAQDFGAESGFLSPVRVAGLTSFIEQEDLSLWTVSPPVDRVPVFLIGFPRSGTTLLDQILSSHPDVTTLEERDTLVDVCRELLGSSIDPRRWRDLADSDVERLRELYWTQVRAGLSSDLARRVFVDKLPLNAVLLPLIYRLFPTAKIVLALRDPRDSVLSCFQQRFGMNGAMYQLLRLETAVSYYDQVMRLVQLCRGKLSLQFHALRYEDVVTQFDGTIESLLQFLDLSWDDNVRNYAETAKSRSIGTPSASQVVQPLYVSAIGKWRNYRRELEPHLAKLGPWVATYGYEP